MNAALNEMRMRFREGLHNSRVTARWVREKYASPAPQRVKLGVLSRYGADARVWVETGTYLGTTTRWLASFGDHVYTIEPSESLAARARERFRSFPNVSITQGLSEDVLPGLLRSIEGDVALWLDGHASGGVTFSGPQVTPIRQELAYVSKEMDRWNSTVVFVDDFRGFEGRSSDDGAYPSRSSLVRWADDHGMAWAVEHDIFIAWSVQATTRKSV